MTAIGAFEAKNQFSKLLDRARNGEEFVITHRGRPVARLLPIREERDSERVREAFDRLRTHVKDRIGPPITHEEIREWIAEGRR